MKALILAGVLLSLPMPAIAADTPFNITLVSYAAASGADLATTMHCLGAQTCREANPIMVPLVGTPAAAGAVKMGTAALVGWLLLHHHKQHPKVTFWLAIAGTSLYSAAAIHNARVARRHRP